MSRHMYDIFQILKTPIAKNAIHNEQLYHEVINHRRTFIGLHGFDYGTLYPSTLNIIPPDYIKEQWKTDLWKLGEHLDIPSNIPCYSEGWTEYYVVNIIIFIVLYLLVLFINWSVKKLIKKYV